MYKLLAIDLDGTLLDSYGDVSSKNKEAVKRANDSGIMVVLTSGRTLSSVKGLANDLGLNDYVIAGNGAIVYSLRENKIIYNNCIPIQKVLKIVELCEENSIYYTINTEKYIISKSLNYNLMYYNYENSKKAEDKKTVINIVENVPKYISENDIGQVTKMTISDATKTIFTGITKKIKDVNGINILEVSNMSRKIIKEGTEKTNLEYFYTEITNENVNKWNALKFLCDEISLTSNDVVAIGDNINDYEMIMNVGLGIVMGESALEARNLGKEVVSSNNLDGVAEAIYKYILK